MNRKRIMNGTKFYMVTFHGDDEILGAVKIEKYDLKSYELPPNLQDMTKKVN